MLLAPQLVVQMPKEPQVPDQTVMMPVVQKVLELGFQLQNSNLIIIVEYNVVHHFIVIKTS